MSKMSLPLAYAMKKKHKHMCSGGDCAHESHYAEGGSVDSWTKRSDNEKGINKAVPGPGGRSEAGAALHPAFVMGDEYDADTAKRKHQKVLGEMRSMPKPKLMAEGGDPADESLGTKIGYPGAPKPKPQMMAEGGSMKSKRERAMEAFHMAEGGYIGSYQSSNSNPDIDGDLMPEAHLKQELAEHIHHAETHDSSAPHDVMNQMGDEDEGAGDMDSIHPMVRRIMMGRAKGYSEGGKVANEESGESTDEPTFAKADGNEFDDLALRDDLEFKSTGANAGDENDDAQENADREDIVSRIMKSRAKKDRMAVPGEGSAYGKNR